VTNSREDSRGDIFLKFDYLFDLALKNLTYILSVYSLVKFYFSFKKEKFCHIP